MMTSNLQKLWRVNLLFVVGILVVLGMVRSSAANTFQPTEWKFAHATFYGDDSAAETMGGACGYGNLHENGYGTDTAALSTVLFNNGFACGSCYEMTCVNSKWCSNGNGGYAYTDTGVTSITITGTNLCPPNWYQASDDGGWCNPPREHFDLAKPAFNKLAYFRAGIIPVKYRRVPCEKIGGIRFEFQGNPYWLLVYVMNVGGAGDICQMWVKGTNTDWISMSQNWGASYQVFSKLGGQNLSFKLKSLTTGEILILPNAVAAGWTPGRTYQTDRNFL